MFNKLFSFLIFTSLLIIHSSVANANIYNVKNEVNKKIEKHKFTSPKEQTDLENLWRKLSKNGYVKVTGDDLELREQVILLQSFIESSIVRSFEKHYFTSIIGIFHTPTPATPLRVKDGIIPLGMVPKKYADNTNIKQTLINRHNNLINLLKLKGRIIAVYPNNLAKTKVIGYLNFLELISAYPNLLTKPVKNLPAKYHGATYLIKDKKSIVSAFSIQASQIHEQPEGMQTWELWLGNIKHGSVAKRVVMIDSFLKGLDIDIYQYLK